MKVGSWVCWTSQSGGFTKTKVGKIIEVVPEDKYPNTPLTESGSERGHESYVVEVVFGQRGGRRVYWPRVTALVETSDPNATQDDKETA